MLRSLVLLLPLGFACAPPPRSPLDYRALDQPVQPAPRTTEIVEAHETTADLDLLAHVLERGYVGRRFVPAESWASMERRLAALRGKRLPVRALCDAIADALWEIPDAHLAARVRAPGAKASVRCGEGPAHEARTPQVGANVGDEATKPWSVSTIAVGQRSVGLLAITAFPPTTDPVWSDFETAIGDLVRKQVLIVDLRGNGGGDDARGRELANRLVDGSVANAVARSYARKTPEALTLHANLLATQGAAPHIQTLLADARRERDQAATSRPPEWEVKEEGPHANMVGPHAFGGPIAILVDAACASSCESTLEMLRRHPHARVFGERTAGHVAFGDIGTFALPNSRIRIIVPTAFAELASGFRGRQGFDPDVTVPPGTDALETARSWIASTTE